jgi:orotidine-5'-phosphate decarboxylase
MSTRLRLATSRLSAGKRARLHRILYQNGLGNGTALFLPYGAEFSSQEAIDAVVRAANRTMLLVSGGSRASDDVMIEKAEESMAAGATGLIFGRNIWQRDHDDSLRLVDRLSQILAKYPTP